MTSPIPPPPEMAPQLMSAETAPPMGARAAAILLISVGDENCAAILRRLAEDEVHQVTREISLLGAVSDEERDGVLKNFERAVERARLFDSGGMEYAQSVLVAAFGPETGKRIGERVLKSLGTENALINSLQKADPEQLAKVVQREHPQAIALVLSHVGPAHAAKLLTALPDEVRGDVVRRMAVLDQISPEVVNKIAKTLGARLRLLGESGLESYSGVRAVAEVLNRVDSKTSDGILSAITDQDPSLEQTIRKLMFVFEDLMHLDEAAMRMLMGKLDRNVLTTALKGCSPATKNHFTSFMSARAVEMLTEDMEAKGPVRIRDVEEAQQTIIATARQLEAEGTLSLKPSSGDQFVV